MMTKERDTSEAYEMYHFLLNFIVKYEIYGVRAKEEFKLLLSKAWGSDDRPVEAAVGQFIAQLDHINEEDEHGCVR